MSFLYAKKAPKNLKLVTYIVELEQGCLYYKGQIYQVPLPRLSYVHLPSPSQYALDLVYLNLVSPKHLDWDH